MCWWDREDIDRSSVNDSVPANDPQARQWQYNHCMLHKLQPLQLPRLIEHARVNAPSLSPPPSCALKVAAVESDASPWRAG